MNVLKRHSIIILLLNISFFASYGHAQGADGVDEVVATNGDHTVGMFQSADATDVTLGLSSGATVTIPWEKTERVVLHGNVKVTLKLTLTSKCKELDFPSPLITFKDKTLSFAVAGGRPQSLLLSSVESISVTSDAEKQLGKPKWAGSINPQAKLSTGTQGQQTLGATVNLQRTQHFNWEGTGQQVTKLAMQANNALSTQVGSPSIRTSQYDAELYHDVYLTKKLYFDVVGYGYHNDSLNIYLEQRYGGGLGGTVFEDCRQSLELTGNLVFIGEHFYGGVPSLGFAAATLTEKYSINLAKVNGRPVSVNETFTYVPAFGQKKAWQLHGRTDLNLPITKSFSTTIGFADDYYENAPKVRKNWSTSSIGITYKF
jgi:Protein of unknown function, DUF481